MSDAAPESPAVLRRTSALACGAVVAVGLVVLVGGWVLRIAALRTLIPGTVEMKALTAVGLAACAAALLLRLAPSGAPARRTAARALALLTAGLGAAVLAEYLFGWRLGIDELLFRDATSRARHVAAPGRFAPTTAIDLLCAGVAVLLLDRSLVRGWRLAELCVLPLVATAGTSVVGYVYDIPSFYGPASAAKMALGTALCFLALAVALLTARPNGRLVRLLVTEDPGGIMMRRLLPLAAGVPVVLGWVASAAIGAHWWRPNVGAWWLSATTALLLTVIVAWVAARMSRLAERQRALEAELQHLVGHDPLTGLENRRRFNERLTQAVQIATRYRSPLTVLVIDFDRMKHVNDELGHAAGDALLCAAGEAIRSRLRAADTAARTGGDEFAVLLPHTELAGAHALAAALVGAVAAVRAGDAWTTVSVGVAELCPADDGPDELLTRADRAMYLAKRGGGDRAATEAQLSAGSVAA